MIICHCQNITDRDIHAAIDWMRRADEQAIVTPGRVYQLLGKTADCGGCMPLFLETMRRNVNLAVPPELAALRNQPKKEKSNAR